MPRYPVTLEMLSHPLDTEAVSKLIQQLSTALALLHQFKLAHMDVKPSNIFVTSQGDFLLGDFGSVRRFGACTSATTAAFLPHEKQCKDSSGTLLTTASYVASSNHDWMMLGITVWDMRVPHDHLQIGLGAKASSWQQMIDTLKGIESPHAAALMERLTASRSKA
jgi:serine/threonine protein kinase